MSELEERYENGIEQIQDLAKSMEKTIRQHQDKPERVCRDNSLKILIKKTQDLLDEMNDCQNGMDKLTQDLINEKTENERGIKRYNAKIDSAYDDIDYRNDAIRDKEREISGSESIVSSLENALRQGQEANQNREEAMEITKGAAFGTYIGGAAFAVGGIFFPVLWIPAAAAFSTSIGTAVAHDSYKKQGEVDVGEIRNRLQNQRTEKQRLEEINENLRQKIRENKSKIEDYREKLDECENSIENYRKFVSAMTVCKKVLTEWLLFLQDLEQSMDRIQSFGSSYLAIKETTAFKDYLMFIEGQQASHILQTSSQMQALEYMDEDELKHMILWNDSCASDTEDSDDTDDDDGGTDDSDRENDSDNSTTDSDDSDDTESSDNTASDGDHNDSDSTSDSNVLDDSDDDDSYRFRWIFIYL